MTNGKEEIDRQNSSRRIRVADVASQFIHRDKRTVDLYPRGTNEMARRCDFFPIEAFPVSSLTLRVASAREHAEGLAPSHGSRVPSRSHFLESIENISRVSQSAYSGRGDKFWTAWWKAVAITSVGVWRRSEKYVTVLNVLIKILSAAAITRKDPVRFDEAFLKTLRRAKY